MIDDLAGPVRLDADRRLWTSAIAAPFHVRVRDVQRSGCFDLSAHRYGETLSFRAGPHLETLGWHGLLDAETALVSQGSYSVWGNKALRRGLFHQEEMSGWHIDRYRLEARMAETLEVDGVSRVFCEARQFSRSETGIAVELADGSSVNTRLLVDCSGRSAVTAGPAVTLRRLDKLVACYSVFTLDEDVEAISVTLVEAVAIGWW
ncbi:MULTISPECIES: NAD(P)/FAD-dependent oxidoreductase [unclassified Bradyrhizobium]